jgi:hypothetical protein
MAKTKITNTSEGARGIETKDGTVFVEPGQTVEVDLADDKADLYPGLEKGEAAAKRAAAADDAEGTAAE